MGLQSNLELTPRFSSQRAIIRRSEFNWSLVSALISNVKFNIRNLDSISPSIVMGVNLSQNSFIIWSFANCSKSLYPGSEEKVDLHQKPTEGQETLGSHQIPRKRDCFRFVFLVYLFRPLAHWQGP